MKLERSSGILLHITSLPSEYGIGDFGPEAFKFIDFLVETKQKLWQMLPLSTTNCPAPYSSNLVFNKKK
jgi:4-alpha-glucanotransferase